MTPEKMPETIWAGKVGSGRIWGEVTPETHPSNTRYTRTDLHSAELERVRECVEKTDCECSRFQCYRCDALAILDKISKGG